MGNTHAENLHERVENKVANLGPRLLDTAKAIPRATAVGVGVPYVAMHGLRAVEEVRYLRNSRSVSEIFQVPFFKYAIDEGRATHHIRKAVLALAIAITTLDIGQRSRPRVVNVQSLPTLLRRIVNMTLDVLIGACDVAPFIVVQIGAAVFVSGITGPRAVEGVIRLLGKLGVDYALGVVSLSIPESTRWVEPRFRLVGPCPLNSMHVGTAIPVKIGIVHAGARLTPLVYGVIDFPPLEGRALQVIRLSTTLVIPAQRG